MLSPSLPKDEASRLIDLINLEILNSNPEPMFDNIVEMASTICGTPISLISFIDSNRQWFKAKKGLDSTETERRISFCGHAIKTDDLFIVSDAQTDERFYDNPLVTRSPAIRFYAGAPLKSISGNAYGTLCVIDTVPRKLNEMQLKLLRQLAKQVEAALEIRKTNLQQNNYIKELRTLSREVVEKRHKLHYMEKLEVLRAMTSGLCHEINNPLSIIMLGNASVKSKLRKCDGMNEEIKKLEKMQVGAERIEKIINGLKLFSLWESNARIPLSVKCLLDETLLLFHEKLRMNGIELIVNCELDAFISVNKGEMIQVISNILLNSIDAVSVLTDKWIKIEITPGTFPNSIRMSISDSGKGIKEELQEKIMQPFFTTKEIGKGTGLGLSICQGIIKEHGGRMYYDTKYSNTCFSLEFPEIA